MYERVIGKIKITSSAITNQLSITMAGLIIDYLFSSDKPALLASVLNYATLKLQSCLIHFLSTFHSYAEKPSCSSVQHFFFLFLLNFYLIWVSHTATAYSSCSLISVLYAISACILSLYDSSNETQSFVSTGSNPVHMATGDINPQILGGGSSSLDLPMESVVCINKFLGPCHLHHLRGLSVLNLSPCPNPAPM